MLTAERVRELLDYNPLTGALTWRERMGGTANKGSIAGSNRKDGYLQTRVDVNRYLNHRIIWLWVTGSWPVNHIDHINGIRNDNRLINLRDVIRKNNNENLHSPYKNNSTGFLGVSKSPSCSTYRARIRHNKQLIEIGNFRNPEDAHNAYIAVKRRLHDGCTI